MKIDASLAAVVTGGASGLGLATVKALRAAGAAVAIFDRNPETGGKAAAETGVLPSLHHPVSKRFPTVSAQDVGSIAAQLLTDGVRVSAPRVVHVEGPRRYDANEVATTLGNILGHEVVARELPQSDWIPILTRAGAGPSYARLVFDLYVTHNAGRIDVEPGATDTRFGTTELRDVFVSLLGR